MKSPNSYRHIYSIVSCIPKGRVATYGQIAQLAGIPGGARLVGYALSILADRSIPWHRVVNARGAISHAQAVLLQVTFRGFVLRRKGCSSTGKVESYFPGISGGNNTEPDKLLDRSLLNIIQPLSAGLTPWGT
ncbi:MGMT family protein [Geotalea toluenoxydans]|uniref:MGMT family protein n=1 Tax=Geotalea toluenoxydans TaxID=421624 RepID=UPI000AEA39BC|nr:MGMT family protein [Geotalea toluenoxydans]